MIVFPRYKIPRHYKFYHQRKNNLKEIRRKHPWRDYSLSKQAGYIYFANIIWSCICIKLFIHYKTSITSNNFNRAHYWIYIYIFGKSPSCLNRRLLRNFKTRTAVWIIFIKIERFRIFPSSAIKNWKDTKHINIHENVQNIQRLNN